MRNYSELEIETNERSPRRGAAFTQAHMLPRLLVFGDVPVEASYHGSMLLYRLLEGYPTHKLHIVETRRPSQLERRLPDVSYSETSLASERWLNTRFHNWVALWFYRSATSGMRERIRDFGNGSFGSVLTVAHGFGWLTAARIAGDLNLPLHLIVHDDWPKVASIPEVFRPWLDQQFKRVFKQASSRMCVSPAMRSRFLERYGEDSAVLFPSRSSSCPNFDAPPARLCENSKPFTVVFAGTINSEGYVRALVSLRDALAEIGGRLLIFGPLNSEFARVHGLDSEGVTLAGLIPSSELIPRLREEADCLFVPMSFEDVDRVNMELAFPSKLADYTAAGIPLLIYGPTYCSAVKWARENEGVAEVVVDEDKSALSAVINRLATDSFIRMRLGERALVVGRKYFSSTNAQILLESALMSSTHSS